MSKTKFKVTITGWYEDEGEAGGYPDTATTPEDRALFDETNVRTGYLDAREVLDWLYDVNVKIKVERR